MKGFLVKVKDWFVCHKPSKQRLIQLYAALLTNANIKGFVSGKIYRGGTKVLCSPGLNCYSCPGAVGACPLGSLQTALSTSDTKTIAYIFGIIVLMSLAFGRVICGFLCPFGLIQDLLYKIKSPKLKKNRVTYVLSYFKYVLLALTIAFAIIYSAVPAFCKYICPAGTLEGAVALLANPSNEGLYAMLGFLFSWKFCILVLVVASWIFINRSFCRFICPLGAIYGFFCKVAMFGIKLDKSKCIDCGKCFQVCKVDIREVGDHECIHCGDCVAVCPTKAISWKGEKLFLQPTSPQLQPVGVAVGYSGQADHTSLAKQFHLQTVAEGGENQQGTLSGSVENGTGKTINNDDMSTTNSQQLDKSSYKIKDRLLLKDRTFWTKIIACVLAGFLLVGSLIYYNFLAPSASGIVYAVGDKCPTFTLETYQSDNQKDHFSVLENRGKVTIINFWFVGCLPCEEEIPYFEQVYEEYNGEIAMVFVHSVDVSRNVQAFLDEKGWANYSAQFAQDSAEINAYEIFGGDGNFPFTVIVDAEGYISHIRVGRFDEASFRKQIAETISK